MLYPASRAPLSLLLTVGNKCRIFLTPECAASGREYVQADELWTFVHTKAGHLSSVIRNEWGDTYIWMAIDSEPRWSCLI